MKKSILPVYILLFSLFGVTSVRAQLVVTPLYYNPALEQYARERADMPGPMKKTGDTVTQKLPFFEDFSNSSVYPRDTMWLDNSVYVNNSFGKHPPSNGVATFDGLDANGMPYKAGAAQGVGQACDTLTSTFIDLSPYSEGDSLYLSFYYQSGGYGEHPEHDDSMVLEFKADSFNNGTETQPAFWIPVWSTRGTILDLPFQQVMIPLKTKTDTNFFYKQFQFRLINYSNPGGNLDIWNVDYIYLNRGRTYTDTAHEDVAVYYPVHSIDKNYYALPWSQFADYLNTELVDSIPVYSTNNSNKVKNVTFGFNVINQADGNIIAEKFNSQGDNLNPSEFRKFNLPVQFGTYPATADDLTLLVNTTLTNIPDDYRMNDTATHKQRFSNYLAYDDGTAENGISMVGGKTMKFAVRFTLNKPDTLYGLAIFFNQSKDYVATHSFSLALWDKISNPGAPENDQPIARIDYVKPQYLKMHNGFAYFEFQNPVPVSNQFYLGWIQTSDFPLNIGLDQNYVMMNGNQANNNVFYSVAGSWKAAATDIPAIQGAPMIRAVIGRKGYVAGIENKESPKLDVKVYPNPGNGIFNISLPDNDAYEIMLLDMQGRTLFQSAGIHAQSQISQQLKPGIYLLRVINSRTGESAVQKVVVRQW